MCAKWEESQFGQSFVNKPQDFHENWWERKLRKKRCQSWCFAKISQLFWLRSKKHGVDGISHFAYQLTTVCVNCFNVNILQHLRNWVKQIDRLRLDLSVDDSGWLFFYATQSCDMVPKENIRHFLLMITSHCIANRQLFRSLFGKVWWVRKLKSNEELYHSMTQIHSECD